MINVRDVPYLLDLDGTPLKALNKREHLEIEHVDNESSVMTLIYNMEETFITEQQIVYRDNRYIISEIEQQKSSRTTTVTAEIAYLELADKNVTVIAEDELLEIIAQKALNGTAWEIGIVEDMTTKHNIKQSDVSSLSVLRLLARLADLKLVFDTINFKVSFLKDNANDVGFLFRYRKNLADITKTTFAPKATTLIPFGKGGLTIESVNNGRRYVEDFSWYESLGYTKSEARRLFNKVHTFSDERFVYAGNLMREAERRLRTLAHPQIAYEVSVSHLDKDIKIGDYGYVIDEELGIKVNVKVVRLIEYEDVNDNQIELNYLIPGLADVQESELETSAHESALQTVFVQNESTFVGDNNFKLLLSMTITNYASTHAQLGLAIVGQASTNTLLELYFDIDGRKYDFEVKQVLQPGYNTIALPMIFTQIQEGSHLLNVFLKVSDGTFTIDRHDAQMFLQAENLQGGLATTLPKANVVEEVEFVDAISVSDVSSISLQTPPPTSRVITEDVVFQLPDPTDRGGLVVLGAANREDFADMSRYTDYTYVPAQENVDDFIDNLYSAYSLFYVVALGDSIYVVTTIGKWIDFDIINNTVRSDGEIFALGYEEGMEQVRNWGRFIDFSDRQLNLEVIEVFNR